MPAAARPSIYEINTAVWLGGRRDAPARTLGGVRRGWDALAALGVDAVWLMGVWERSPAGLAIAHADPGLAAVPRGAPRPAPGGRRGSPYCVRRYVVDERFGGPEALAGRGRSLPQRGLGLVLDFVPNHVAPDHPWVRRAAGSSWTARRRTWPSDPGRSCAPRAA